jgi:hypothetical protein
MNPSKAFAVTGRRRGQDRWSVPPTESETQIEQISQIAQRVSNADSRRVAQAAD